MAAPPILLDQIGRVTTPSWSVPTARIFVFDFADDKPGFIVVYVAEGGKAIPKAAVPTVSFTRSRVPRRDPHIVQTQSGEQWEIIQAGCGCGSPIRRVPWTQALKDYEAAQAAEAQAVEAQSAEVQVP